MGRALKTTGIFLILVLLLGCNTDTPSKKNVVLASDGRASPVCSWPGADPGVLSPLENFRGDVEKVTGV